MKSIDLSPLYRSTVGYDRLASLLDSALSADSVAPGYPPYNIEMLGENRYAVTVAVAGFDKEELDINVEKGVLTIRGSKGDGAERKYLYQGIANRTFERKFNLADYVEVRDADLSNGLLTVNLVKEIPEAMKPRSIAINADATTLEHDGAGAENEKAA
jgi:molecular chaperone IbpA